MNRLLESSVRGRLVVRLYWITSIQRRKIYRLISLSSFARQKRVFGLRGRSALEGTAKRNAAETLKRSNADALDLAD
jgi:hypothetical protein